MAKTTKIIFPPAIEVWYILPAVRKHISLELIKTGLAQKQVAKIIGVTEASISHYKKDKRAKEDILDEACLKLVKIAAGDIAKDPLHFYKRATTLLNEIKKTGLLCRLYEEKTVLTEKERACGNCKEAEKKLCFEE